MVVSGETNQFGLERATLGLTVSSLLRGASFKLFDTPEEFVQYKEGFDHPECSGIKKILHIGSCEDQVWTICLVIFGSGRRLFCFVRLDV